MRSCLLVTLLVAACASGPIPAGKKPAGVVTPGSDPRFPAGKFVSAVGSTAMGAQAAPDLLAAVDAAARAAVIAQLGTAAGADVSSLDLAAAVTIPERWREGETAYAWAVLDKSQALAQQQAHVADHEQKAKALLQQGDGAEAATPGEALRAFARARSEAEAATGGLALLRGLGGTAEPTGTGADADGKIAALLGKLVLTLVEGDRQRGADGKGLAKPLVVTAWMAGKRAAGLPLAALVSGRRAGAAATVDADGRAAVRVDDLGKFAKAEQEVQVGVDWAALLGVAPDKAPAWTAAAPNAFATAAALKKGVGTTRVLVLLDEKIDGGAELEGRPVAAGLTRALQRAGFDVQDAAPILAKFGAGRLVALSDAQLKEAARRVADVVVIGTATSRPGAGGSYRARGEFRAIDLGSGQVVFKSPADESQGKRSGEAGARSALEALGEALGPGLEKALRAAAGQ